MSNIDEINLISSEVIDLANSPEPDLPSSPVIHVNNDPQIEIEDSDIIEIIEEPDPPNFDEVIAQEFKEQELKEQKEAEERKNQIEKINEVNALKTASISKTDSDDDLIIDEPTIVDYPVKKRKTTRGASQSASASNAAASNTCSSVGAPLKTRKSAGNCVYPTLWTPNPQNAISDLISENLNNLGIQTKLKIETSQLINGISCIITAEGKFDDIWDSHAHSFVKIGECKETLNTAFVLISADFMNIMRDYTFDQKQAYFLSVETLVSNLIHQSDLDLHLVYLVPELHKFIKKLDQQYDRHMRKRARNLETQVSSDIEQPPTEVDYLDLETDLEVMHNLRILFPKKMEECAELLANCLVDLGYSRYRSKIEVNSDSIVRVKSKQASLDITLESLLKIQGLRPKIAASLASEMRSMGGIYKFLGPNASTHVSKLEKFGKGVWTKSLTTFLNTNNPDDII